MKISVDSPKHILWFTNKVKRSVSIKTVRRLQINNLIYQERRAYRPQIVAYTFSKLVYEANRVKKNINFRQIWDNQNNGHKQVFYDVIVHFARLEYVRVVCVYLKKPLMLLYIL